jgi:hypothetical protein
MISVIWSVVGEAHSRPHMVIRSGGKLLRNPSTMLKAEAERGGSIRGEDSSLKTRAGAESSSIGDSTCVVGDS